MAKKFMWPSVSSYMHIFKWLVYGILLYTYYACVCVCLCISLQKLVLKAASRQTHLYILLFFMWPSTVNIVRFGHNIQEINKIKFYVKNILMRFFWLYKHFISHFLRFLTYHTYMILNLKGNTTPRVYLLKYQMFNKNK